MSARQIVIVCGLVSSLVLPIGSARAGSPDVAGEDDGSKPTNHPKTIELSIAPNKISWVKLDVSSPAMLRKYSGDLRLLLYNSQGYAEQLPLENQHTEDEMDKLRKDASKWYATYTRELRKVLKDQYYVWKEINRIAEALEQQEKPIGHYTLSISLKDSVSGIEQVDYYTMSYLEARAIAEDIRNGVIKSVTVHTGHLRGALDSAQDEWVPCAPACQISAFGY